MPRRSLRSDERAATVEYLMLLAAVIALALVATLALKALFLSAGQGAVAAGNESSLVME